MAWDFKTALAKLSKKQRIALVGGVVVVVLGLYGYFLINPMWEDKGKLEGDLEKLQGDLRQKQLIAGNRPKLEKEIKDLEAKLGKASRIYHELIPAGGEDGVRVLKELHENSYQIVKARIDKA